MNPRPLRDVSGDVVLVTGAGGLYSSIGYLWGPASVFFWPEKKEEEILMGTCECYWESLSTPG